VTSETGTLYEVSLFPVHHYLQKIGSMEINSVELYFSFNSDGQLFSSSEYEEIVRPRLKLQQNFNSFVGLAQSNLKRFSKISQMHKSIMTRNFGKDIAHSMRALDMVLELINT